MNSDEWNARLAEAVALATTELEQLAKNAERMAEQTRLFGERQRRKQGNVYSAVSGARVKPVKGYSASTAKAEHRKAKRAKQETKRTAKTSHTQHKAPTV